jgi:hypothetical protein
MQCIINFSQMWESGEWQGYQDSALIDSAQLVEQFLSEHSISQVSQPPHDFSLFPKQKNLEG